MSSDPIPCLDRWSSSLLSVEITLSKSVPDTRPPSGQCDPASTVVHSLNADEEMPPHWTNSYPRWPRLEPYLRAVFTALCFIGIGRPDLTEKWRALNTRGDHDFQKHTQRVSGNLSAINLIVAGLLLTSAVGFVTTVPPRPDLLDYTIRGPYLFLFASFGIILGGMIVGCAVLFLMSTLDRKWTKDVLMSTRLRIWIVLALLSYPFLSVGTGTTVGVLALFVSTWISADLSVGIGCSFLLAIPASLFVFLALISRKPKNVSDKPSYQKGFLVRVWRVVRWHKPEYPLAEPYEP